MYFVRVSISAWVQRGSKFSVATVSTVWANQRAEWTIFRWCHAYAEVWLLLRASCLGGQHALSNVLHSMGKYPTSASIPACKLHLGIATHERIALFVEQRERFHLPFVATLCDLPSPRYSLLEITLSFWNAQSVPILVSRPCIRDFWRSWLDKGAQSDEPRPCW